MHLLIAIVGAIVAIFSVIILHELGHFFVARFFRIKILRFSIGFGKALWKRVGKDGTEYIFALLPFGGYVKMLGEGEEITDPADIPRAYNRKPLLVRMAVVVAGPVMNFIVAVIAFWGVYLMGVTHMKPLVGYITPHSIAAQAGMKYGDELIKIDGARVYNWQRAMMQVVAHMGNPADMIITVRPWHEKQEVDRKLVVKNWKVDQRNPDFFESLGISPFEPKIDPVVSEVLPNSPAEKAGLQAGDRILAMNGQKVDDWNALVKDVQRKPGQTIALTILRQHQQQKISLQIGSQKSGHKTVGYLGVMSVTPELASEFMQKEQYSIFQAWIPAVQQVWHLTLFNFVVIGKMITGKISMHTLGGPVTVFQAAGEASVAGWQIYLGFIGFISLTLGFINLLPIPGLDGGHLLFQVIEGIFRRPVPERIQMIGLGAGMVFLIFLMVQATINDIMRLFSH